MGVQHFLSAEQIDCSYLANLKINRILIMNKIHLHLTLTILVSTLLNACGSGNSNDENKDSAQNSIITATDTCVYSDFTIEAASIVNIDCLLDLQGNSELIPDNVYFQFEGGDIFNGTLSFANGGQIDGELLNDNLTVEGDVLLASNEFQFYHERWNRQIVEGNTDSDTALSNNTNLENLFFFVKELGASTIYIDEFDAYFEVTRVTSTTSNQNFYPSLEALNIPSDVNLVMTDNTHLRIFPGGVLNTNGGGILGIRDAENITISGGNLYGDRDTRVYSADEDGEQGTHLIKIQSGRNVTIDNVNFENGSGGSITISSFGFPFNDDYNPSNNITISNSTFLNSRRMSIALTDGNNVTINNNHFINTGQESSNSTGGEVGYAINIEPYRTRDENGNLIEYQKVTNALIKGNTETNSRGGFLTLTIGQDIVVEDNTIDTRMVWSFVSGVRIRNNTFNANDSWAAASWAFYAAGTGETVFDNEFSNNIISGYALGAVIGSIDIDVFDNTITDVKTGFQLLASYNAKIYNNDIQSNSQGLYIGNTYTNNSEITNNKITAPDFLVKVSNINKGDGQEDYSILIDGNDFIGNGSASIFLSNGINFSNNAVEGGVQVGDSINSVVDNNTITANEHDGIKLYNTAENITISNNVIYESTGADRFECINNESDTPSEITLSNNTCS